MGHLLTPPSPPLPPTTLSLEWSLPWKPSSPPRHAICTSPTTRSPLQDPEWAGGGPGRALLELDPKEWEWSTVPQCSGMTVLRRLTGPTRPQRCGM